MPSACVKDIKDLGQIIVEAKNEWRQAHLVQGRGNVTACLTAVGDVE